jgi:hypothetical protein
MNTTAPTRAQAPQEIAMSPHVSLPEPLIRSLPRGASVRRAAALVLHGASLALAGAARRLVAVQASAPDALPHLRSRIEFHAEAGAPEGALYVDGKFVGYLPGVKRL